MSNLEARVLSQRDWRPALIVSRARWRAYVGHRRPEFRLRFPATAR
ncbi:MAG TPA: hypothetical protein QF606_02110 [Anaerolineales bacterium]|nr:hypothetical protein [Anaerolineales bacterium]